MGAVTPPWPGPGYLPGAPHGQLRDYVQAGTRFDVSGNGPAVVLIHGVGLDHRMWDGVAARLAEDYTVIRYDMLGHGESSKPVGPLSLYSFMHQLVLLQQYFRLEKFALVGFSMGALVAQAYALAHGDYLSRLVLLHGVYDRNAEQRAGVMSRLQLAREDGPGAIIDAAIARWFTPAFQDSHPDEIARVRARLEANEPRDFLAAYEIFAGADAELAGRIMDIRCPTTIATGELDMGSTPFMSQEMATEIPGARCEIFDGLAHGAPVEDPERVTALIQRALTRRAGG